MSTHRPTHPQDREAGHRGQVLVLFALALVSLVAMAGLVLDGGGAFALRRELQAAADLSAMAGANAYMNEPGIPTTKRNAAVEAVLEAAADNGFPADGGGTIVTPVVELVSSGATVRVDLTAEHENGFARIVGADRWAVSVTATAVAGTVDTGIGAAPWLMHIGAFLPDGTPRYTTPTVFGEANGDYPSSGLDLAWTDFNGEDNVNTDEVTEIIEGANVVTATMDFEQYLGQHNEGNHTALFGDVLDHLAGRDLPVPIVGPGSPDCAAPMQVHQDGCFQGWAMFHIVTANQGGKTITGYFLSDFVSLPLTVGACTDLQVAAGSCGVISESPFGAYVIRLTQ